MEGKCPHENWSTIRHLNRLRPNTSLSDRLIGMVQNVWIPDLCTDWTDPAVHCRISDRIQVEYIRISDQTRLCDRSRRLGSTLCMSDFLVLCLSSYCIT